jgi:SAM-dependent methyltransferase
MYERLMAAPAAAADEAAPRQIQSALDLTDAELDLGWHRLAIGGKWRESGEWQLQFLRAQGLECRDFVLDVGCGSLAGARVMLPFMDEHRYWGYEKDRRLFEAGVAIELVRANVRPERGHLIVNDWFDLSESPHLFRYAIANGFWSRLPLNQIARAVAAVLRKLEPGGRFYATWFDTPDGSTFEPIVHPHGATTYSDMEPYHYSYDVLAGVIRALGADVTRVADATHPRGESIMLITRSHAA